MKKLFTSKAFLKMADGRMHTPHPTSSIRPWPKATEAIKRVWHVSVIQHH